MKTNGTFWSASPARLLPTAAGLHVAQRFPLLAKSCQDLNSTQSLKYLRFLVLLLNAALCIGKIRRLFFWLLCCAVLFYSAECGSHAAVMWGCGIMRRDGSALKWRQKMFANNTKNGSNLYFSSLGYSRAPEDTFELCISVISSEYVLEQKVS